jgi:hypothetical protein
LFAAVLLATQHIAEDGTANTKEGVKLKFHLVARPHFPVDVTFARIKDLWVIVTSSSDPNEGADAPSLLEIQGTEWRLFAHDPDHTKRMVAKGTF